MDLISVIMPTHNAAKWVTHTIDNLAAQTYPHFELIVSDDGSQDDTVSVVRSKLAKSFKNPWQIIERRNGRAIIHKAPMRVACSYLVTAWPVGIIGEAAVVLEHHLLSQALQALAGNPTIPAALLVGTSLEGQEPPLPMIAAQSETLKSSSEFWSSLGNKLRASVSIYVTFSMPVFPDVDAPMVTTRTATVNPGGGLLPETMFQIGGRVLSGPGHGVAGALVEVTDSGLQAVTDPDGFYVFPQVPQGLRSFRVAAVGFAQLTQSITVPGGPADYQITLTPL